MKSLSFLLIGIVLLAACSSKQSVDYANRIELSGELVGLIDDSFKESKALNVRPTILLMHVLYDSLGSTKIVITPTSSARIAGMHSPDFVSRIGNKAVFIYASNGKVFNKSANYLARTSFIADSVLPASMLTAGDTKGAIYIDEIKRIGFKNGHPYLNYSSKLIPPLLGTPPLPSPPIPIMK